MSVTMTTAAKMAEHEKPKLVDQIEEARRVMDSLRQYGIKEDDPDFWTMLENEADVFDRLRRIARAIIWMEVEAKAARDYAKQVVERAQASEERAERLRGVLFSSMKRLGTGKPLKAPDLTAYIAKGKKKVVVTNPVILPADYTVTKVEPIKEAIRKAIENGEEVPGAELIDGEDYLAIKV